MIPERQNDIFLEWIEHHDSILRKIARAWAAPGERTDVYQDLLIAVWHAVRLYRGQAAVSTFIYRVALNCVMNRNRSRRVWQRRHVELDGMVAPAVPEDNGSEHQRVEELYAALGALSEADRSLALLYLDDLSYREIAEVLGISETNVGVRLNRIRKRLANRLRHEQQTGGTKK